MNGLDTDDELEVQLTQALEHYLMAAAAADLLPLLCCSVVEALLSRQAGVSAGMVLLPQDQVDGHGGWGFPVRVVVHPDLPLLCCTQCGASPSSSLSASGR